jgi:hypothetical protein
MRYEPIFHDHAPVARGHRPGLDRRALLLISACIAFGSGSTAPCTHAQSPPPLAESTLHTPAPELFFNVAYCGSGRKNDPTTLLDSFDWKQAAEGFRLTILSGATGRYRDLAKVLRQFSPDHQVLVYVHAHGLHMNHDRPAVLNLEEGNFLHATDPAGLWVTQLPEGVRLDWIADERANYDEYGIVSIARKFEVGGYAVYRQEEDGEPVELARIDVPGSSYVDSTAAAGVAYRYWVKTIAATGHVIDFSMPHSVGVERQRQRPPVLVRDHERGFEAAVDRAIYTIGLRFQADGPATAARVRIDLNADRDFEDEGETVVMERGADGRFEAVFQVDASKRGGQSLRRIVGYAYVLEIDGTGGTITLPAVGSYTTNINNRIRHRRYGFYIMRPSTDAWFQHRVQEIRRQSGNWRFVSGVFLDELVVDLRYSSEAAPLELTTATFQRESVELVRRLTERYSDFRFYYNGVGAGVDPPGTVGGMLEGFGVAPWHRGGVRPGIASPPVWEKQLGDALEMAGRRRELLLLARDMPRDDLEARLFALASFHLVRGAGTRFCYLPERCGGRPLPEWDIDLGAPLESFTTLDDARRGASGIYGRRFERGEVLVNGDSEAAHRVDLEAPGYLVTFEGAARDSLSVGRWVGAVELAPQTAAIVLRP